MPPKPEAGGDRRPTMHCGFAALVGRPNAGKSTLLNHLVGEKLAIVSDKPQTTRHRILGVRHYPGGQVAFLDTPGIHRPLHRMNVQMVESAVETFRQADVLVVVVDASAKTGQGDRFLLSLLERVTTPTFLALNKIDRIAKPQLLPLIEWYRTRRTFAEVIPISALTGEGVDVLERLLLDRMPDGDPLYPTDYLTDQPERFFASEIVREKVLRHTRAELPFSTAVVIDRFEEADGAGGIVRLYASILVDRASQKAIVIGRQGSLVARIGTEAREELERFFGRRVFLDLHVRVRPNWREDTRWLAEMGLRPGSH